MSNQTEKKIYNSSVNSSRTQLNNQEKIKSFDWTKYETHLNNEIQKERKKFEKIYAETLPNIQELEIYKGIVTHITERNVIVDIGFKAEGSIPIREFRENFNFEVGSNMEVMVVKMDYKGQCILSYQKAKTLRNWQRINEAYEKGEILLGYVEARTKGGLIVEIFDIECFLPGSHINVKPVRDYETYVGKTMEVKIVKINQKTKNVVVSHKILIEKDIEEQRKEMISKLDKGQVLEGKIKNILPYGAFVDLGGVDALLHITDMSWHHINHPTEVVQLEQELKFVVLGVDKDKNRVQLGLKQLQPHPWNSLDENLKVGSKVKGKVSILADYGAFVEIIPGVEALLHISEMSWSSDLSSTQDFVQIGDELEAVILTIDRKERKMSLSVKQLTPDPWINIHKKYTVGSRHVGTVLKFTNFGIFLELEKGISGILYSNDLSWGRKIKHPSEFCNINDHLEVIVLSLDPQTRRLNLGHKQLTENPWDKYEKTYSVGSIHNGRIVHLFDKGAYIQLSNPNQEEEMEIEAFAPFRFLEKKDGSILKKGEKINFQVIDFNKENKKIIVSHTAIHRDKKKKRNNRKFERSTLGDIAGLAKLKEKIEKEKK
ncbi:MAG: 30S ribosomal protein S1 [Flavobacteriales bacterium]|jgi:small subunit ribosomal protein S1|uniref:30S ribosomal protein S1 n=1 Tax=Blattabacterium sp. (Mastotermes darwiniensis) TaxID=39768 RepID=UPI000231DE31|nr:30S ribosomal protein S1 [Blattabacterium sp. (Mastotermes darwiniensis)]AER40613.1 30S ribosomal protein S1 [Blattabacterium sp. (Mastotermes darwiniensis) str. MADAR]MDR1805110.1 30S ribosomal protein S1 [Flavobacteriales bacterium]